MANDESKAKLSLIFDMTVLSYLLKMDDDEMREIGLLFLFSFLGSHNQGLKSCLKYQDTAQTAIFRQSLMVHHTLCVCVCLCTYQLS